MTGDRASLYDHEAEITVLGAILLNPNVLTEVSKIISAQDFHHPTCQWCFQRILKLQKAEAPITPEVLLNQIPKTQYNDWAPFVTRAIDQTPTSDNAVWFARHIRDFSYKRRAVDLSNQILDGFENDDQPIEEVLAGIQDSFRMLSESLKNQNEKKEGWTASELVEQEFPPPRWIVPGIYCIGTALLVGRPKRYKSYKAMNHAVAISTGGKSLGTIDVEKGDVLGLFLEDSPGRLKKRLLEVLNGTPAPDNLHLHNSWPRLNAGGLSRIEDWLKKHPDARLVVVDPLQKVREPHKRMGDVYGEDYEALTGLSSLAHEYDVCVLVIHHDTKARTLEHFIDLVSGSRGLTGAADAISYLGPGERRADAILHVVGRDIEETELALSFDTRLMTWILLGESELYKKSLMKQEVIELLRESDEPISPTDISNILEKPYNTITKTLFDLKKTGDVITEGRGKYKVIK